MIRASELRKVYSGGPTRRVVLDGVEFAVEPGTICGLVGSSGAGKTSLLNILGGLDSDYSGRVEVDGVRLSELSDTDLAAHRRDRVGFMFQDFHLLEHLSAIDNALLACRFSTRTERRRFRTRAMELLALVGLEGRGDDRPSALSGGERQRVALARALLRSPRVILADEPTGNLDSETGRRLMDLLAAQVRDLGACLVVATHDERVARYADLCLRLERGQLAADNGSGGAA